MMRSFAVVTIVLASRTLAHGNHDSQAPLVAEDVDWVTRHMAEEHHMSSWDSASFFSLHDYNADGLWQSDELLRTYGLMDPSNQHVTAERRREIVDELMILLDKNGDRAVSKDEWQEFSDAGKTLPNMGTGPGHHGDDEYEYEIHHWEKYHDENTKLEDLTHPEDIEHFAKHEKMEEEEERLEKLDKMSIVEENIPAKFRNVG